MTVAFVVEGASTADAARTAAAGTPARSRREPDPDPEEAIDPAELVNAGPEHDVAPLERVAQAFPGAEFVDEG